MPQSAKTNGYTGFVAEDIPTEDRLSDTITAMHNHCMIYIGPMVLPCEH